MVILNKLVVAVMDPGGDPGDPAPAPPPLFLHQTEAQRCEKKFFGGPFPPYLRVRMTVL